MGLIIHSSAIHAAGCYTTAPIRKGTRIIEYTGPRVAKGVADEMYAEKPCTYLFGLSDGKTVIDGDGMAAFINHSCDPNCETAEDEQGRVWIWAIRDIAGGEELTYDYCLCEGDGDEPCACGTQHCRGTMYSRKELRKRERVRAGRSGRRRIDHSPQRTRRSQRNKTNHKK